MERERKIVVRMLIALTLLVVPCIHLYAGAVPRSGWERAELIENDDTGNAGYPEIAMDGSGNAIAVWFQHDGSHWNVLANRYSRGIGWGYPELIEDDDTGSADSPKVAMDSSGNAIAVWSQTDGTRYNIWANRFTSGVGWGKAELIEAEDAGDALDPCIAFDDFGNAFAVWKSIDGYTTNIWVNRYTIGGGWGTQEMLETGDSGAAFHPVIAMDGSGDAFAVWCRSLGDKFNILARRYTYDEAVWGVAELIETDDSGDALNPEVSMDGSGNAITVWYQFDGSRYNIYANRYTPGTGWGTAELIEKDNSGDAYEPQLALADSGDAIAAWVQSDGSIMNVWANRYTAGVGWGEAEVIENDGAGNAAQHHVSMDGSGNAVAVWVQSDGIRTNLHANCYMNGIGWGEPELVETDNSGSVSYPKVAMDGSGKAITVWVQHNGPTDNIWANVLVIPDTTPPSLSVEGPSEGYVSGAPLVNVHGTTEPGSILSINNILSVVRPDGSFSCNISLSTGTNVIVVASRDEWDNTATVVRTVEYIDPFGSVHAKIASLRENLTMLASELNVTEEEQASINENLTRIGSSLDANLDELGSIQEALAALISELEEMNDTLGSIGSDVEDAEAELASVSGSSDDLRSDLDDTKEELDRVKSMNIVLLVVLILVILMMIIGLIVMLVRTSGKREEDVYE